MTSPFVARSARAHRGTGCRHRIVRLLLALGIAVVVGRDVRAQEAMLVTGQVTAGMLPVSGALVEIAAARVTTSTNAAGRYQVLVPASRVTGQVATLVVRHARYGSQSAPISLVGGSVVHDFDLTVPAAGVAQAGASRTALREWAAPTLRRTVDSTVLAEVAGPADLASALAGRLPGLLVTSAATPGASALMVFHGPRTIAGSMQPLVVVDGIPVDNGSFASPTQSFGLGGFDYGSPLQDIALDDIASVSLVTGADAVAAFGSRAANGVLMVTSRTARGTSGVRVSATVRSSVEDALRLPAFQGAYGQGRHGQFEFFDGAGGGINDGVEESWGPALGGQLLPQASLTEARRPDVRPWMAGGDPAAGWFRRGRTIDAGAVMHAAGSRGDLRLAANGMTADGLAPSSVVRRVGGSLGAAFRPAPRVALELHGRAVATLADARPGTGFDEVNAAAGFTRMGRQVDLGALREHLAVTGTPVNWIYTTRNNPWVQVDRNEESDRRAHLLGGGVLTVSLAPGVALVGRAAIDDDRETRDLAVTPGWLGGYPTTLGRVPFPGGGRERASVDRQERSVGAGVTIARGDASSIAFGAGAGADYRVSDFASASVLDGATPAPGAGAPPGAARASGSRAASGAYVTGSLALRRTLRVDAALRAEAPSEGASDLYPAISGALDLFGGAHGLAPRATLHGGWWRVGNALGSWSLAQAWAGASVSCGSTCTNASPRDPSLGVSPVTPPQPERTRGLEGGLTLESAGRRLSLDFSAYAERTSGILLAPAAAQAPAQATATGVVSNRGLEVVARVAPVEGRGVAWSLTAALSRNRNRVESLGGGLEDVPLGPALFGATLVARAGYPLGAIVGTRYLRDSATGDLLLTNGLPSPGPRDVLGAWSPDWLGSLQGTLRRGDFELSVLVDTRAGGKLFSATNMAGSVAGTLALTADRPASGLVIHGLDAATRVPNAVAVPAEDYFHALAGIHEAWVYDASFVKLRDARIAWTRALSGAPVLRAQSVRVALIARNLVAWTRVPNVDPETTLSTGSFQGFEMGQLPSARSVGLQLTLTP